MIVPFNVLIYNYAKKIKISYRFQISIVHIEFYNVEAGNVMVSNK